MPHERMQFRVFDWAFKDEDKKGEEAQQMEHKTVTANEVAEKYGVPRDLLMDHLERQHKKINTCMGHPCDWDIANLGWAESSFSLPDSLPSLALQNHSACTQCKEKKVHPPSSGGSCLLAALASLKCCRLLNVSRGGSRNEEVLAGNP